MHGRSNTPSDEKRQNHAKKKTIEYGERDEVERAEYQAEISEVPKETRYYVDQSGINKYLYREYGYALRGEKVYGKVQGKKFERVNIVAAQCGKEIVGRCEYTCNMNSKLFELWFVQVLLPEIPKGSVIIMDRASWHRKKVLKKLAEEASCRVIFLPAYSPDFNPIEQTWANLKTFIKNFMLDFSSLNDAINHYFQFA